MYHALKLGHVADSSKAKRDGNYEKVKLLMTQAADVQAIKFGMGLLREPPPDVAAPSPERTSGTIGVLRTEDLDERPLCEPECNEYPRGMHHTCRTQAYVQAGNDLNMTQGAEGPTAPENATLAADCRHLASEAEDNKDVIVRLGLLAETL